MSTVLRQKSCNACAESKRRCDRQLPQCRRCLDRDEDCVYPQRKRRRKERGPRVIEEASIPGDHASANTIGDNFNFGEWDTLENHELDVSVLDGLVPSMPLLPPLGLMDNRLTQDGGLTESENLSIVPKIWFLQDETWVMEHIRERPELVTEVEQEAFLHSVYEMLQCWVKSGHNGFIHRRLYEKGMPTCLQDAFTTLATYIARTPAVKETILQIAEERSLALARERLPAATGLQAILAHLSRVQALFVYEYIRLLDGSVRLRVSAEAQIPTLRLWVIEMWEATRRYQGENVPLQWSSTEFEREYNTSMVLWKQWILTESVRRTHILADSLANLYQTMSKGWVECNGAVMLTARSGLWEADSSIKWLELTCAKSPLLVPCLQPELLMSQYAADEVDDLVKVFWKILVGVDKIQSWIDRGKRS